MRIAIVTDVHGNLTALEAVLADLRRTAPDLILHGGDLVHGGARPAEVLDRIRGLGWAGVVGNTDEMLFRPEALDEFARASQAPGALFAAIAEQAEATRERLGGERLAWLAGLPREQRQGPVTLVHASPEDLWRAPLPEAEAAELEGAYAGLGAAIAVYGHVHRPYVRSVGGFQVANCGSVSLSHDGDARASYLLVDGERAAVRRVEYDLEAELRALAQCGIPHADWLARMLREARPSAP